MNSFEKLNEISKKIYLEADFSFLLAVMIIDKTDNADYFMYKFNISKKDQKRIKYLDKFYKSKVNKNTFTEKNLVKKLYFDGKESVLDILNFKILTNKKIDQTMINPSAVCL